MNLQSEESAQTMTTQELAEEAITGCVALRVRMLSRALTNLYNQALRPYQLRVTQRAIIAVVALQEELTPKRLGQLMVIEASTVSRNVERMKAMGWLATKRSNDGRSHLIRLTAEGKALLAETETAWQEAQLEAQRLFGHDPLYHICTAADQMWDAEQARHNISLTPDRELPAATGNE